MPTFIMALTINPNAKKHQPEFSQHVTDSLDRFAANNLKVQHLFATLGRYDYVAIFAAEDQTTAFKVATQINNLGILETETWPVIDYDDYSQLLK